MWVKENTKLHLTLNYRIKNEFPLLITANAFNFWLTENTTPRIEVLISGETFAVIVMGSTMQKKIVHS